MCRDSRPMSNASGASRISPQAVSNVDIRARQVRVAGARGEVGLVQVAEHQAFQLPPRTDATGLATLGSGSGPGDQPHALVAGRQEVGVPDLEPVVRAPSPPGR